MKTEKKYLMYGIGLVLLTLVGVSLAYFATQIVGDKKQVSIGTGDLRVVFTDSDGSITGTDIEPGWSTTKTFSVENKTNSEYKYDILIEDLVNTFKTTGYLVYKITSTNGYNMTDYVDVPKRSTETDTVLAYNITIPSKTTHNYTIELRYNNSEEVDQSDDMNSTLSGKVYITKGSAPTLADLILRDNPILSERTDFSETNTSDTTGTIYKTNKTEDGSEVYYYSGNTTNNWVKFGEEDKISCFYNGRIVEHYENGKIETEAECLSSNVCEVNTLPEQNSTTLRSVIKYEHYYTVGITESACANLGGTYLSEKATWKNGPHDIYWRIIRTNEDDSVRLLYSGTSYNSTEGYIGFSVFNSSKNSSRYVGYMYGGTSSLADNRTNTTDSTIKEVIDTWYQTYLLINYDKYVSKTAIYCSDKSVSDGIWSDYGHDNFYYGAYTRLWSNKAPNYKCGANATGGLFESTQAVEDKFSVSDAGGGNGDLTYGIALMTADEISFAGGVAGEQLSSPYAWYYTNSEGEGIIGENSWWLLSPHYWYGKGLASVFAVDAAFRYSGTLSSNNVNTIYNKEGMYAVRPVLSVSSCAKFTGTGTVTNPYVIDETTSSCS